MQPNQERVQLDAHLPSEKTIPLYKGLSLRPVLPLFILPGPITYDKYFDITRKNKALLQLVQTGPVLAFY